MKPAKVRTRKSLLLHNRHGECITERQSHRRGGRRGDRFGPYFPPVRQDERSLSRGGEHGTAVTRDGNDRNTHPLEMIDDRIQLCGLAALRDQDCNIALGGHTEVAVNCFGEMQEGRLSSPSKRTSQRSSARYGPIFPSR